MSDTKEPQAKADERSADGRFKPGYRGGPGGSRAMPDEIKEMLKAATPKAVRCLIDALGDESCDMRLKAANAILDRLYGKPAQAITNEDGSPIRIGIMVLPEEKGE